MKDYQTSTPRAHSSAIASRCAAPYLTPCARDLSGQLFRQAAAEPRQAAALLLSLHSRIHRKSLKRVGKVRYAAPPRQAVDQAHEKGAFRHSYLCANRNHVKRL